MSLDSALDRLGFWQRASRRERAMLAAGVLVVIAALLVAWVALPLAHFLAVAPQARAVRAARLDDARERVAALSRAQPARDAAAPADALGRALDGAGIPRSAATLDVAADRIALTLPGARLAEVASVMAGATREGLVVSAATLSALAEPGLLRAELAFERAGR